MIIKLMTSDDYCKNYRKSVALYLKVYKYIVSYFRREQLFVRKTCLTQNI